NGASGMSDMNRQAARGAASESGDERVQPASEVTLRISLGRQRTVRLIGRQQTVQSSINDCSDCEVSICSGKVSPQCGQVMSVSMTSSMVRVVAVLVLKHRIK